MGYLSGGLLLAINVVMIQLLPGTWGPPLSFLSVAVWWAIFSVPVLTQVPEPPSATAVSARGESVVMASFRRLWETLKDVQRYRELSKFLIAFLIYNEDIGTIIGVVAIYGAELRFGDAELILVILLVQFVGIPFSPIFGRLPSQTDPRRPVYLTFILFNLIALPLVGIVGARSLSAETTGGPLPPYAATDTAVGKGTYLVDDAAPNLTGAWDLETVSAAKIGADEDVAYRLSRDPAARYDLAYNGQKVEITYSTGPDRGIWTVEIDGQPYIDEDTGAPLEIDAFSKTVRYGVQDAFIADEPGEHTLSLINSGHANEKSQGTVMTVARVDVEAGCRVAQEEDEVVLGPVALNQIP